VAGAVVGQPLRRRLRPDDDPFGAVGIRVGSFLVRPAIELGGGYDSNPARFVTPRSSSFYRIAPELLAASDWSRHSVIVDLRGSYTGYEKTFPAPAGQISSAPVDVDRIEFNGKVNGRLDVTRDNRVNGEFRLRVGADNPGSPNIQAGLAKFPLFTSTGGTLGVEQDFNRLQVKLDGTVDRIAYQDSQLTNGVTTTNDDRNYNQYGGVGRVSYELLPGLRPFGEIQGDTRVHDTKVDRSLYQRDSDGGYVKAGTTFELTRLLTGEVSVGYAARRYADPRLQDLKGLLTTASLVWTATPLTTAKFISVSSIDETTLAGVPGVLTRTYTFEVDHDFRRWLTAIGRFTYGTQDYQESTRFDQIYGISGDLVFKLNREFQIKAQVRHDRLESNIAGASTNATVVMLGVRLQR
ncbi:MAG TPA: outer membrane beta-barrel protein, partial [Tardiphaga sp.]